MARPRLRFFSLFFLGLALAVWLCHPLWLPWFGRHLVLNEAPFQADIAVVLAGDQYGHRMEKGAELIRDGYVPKALVSGPRYYHIHECDIAISYAVNKGYPAEWFIPLPHDARSTAEESALIFAELQRRHVHRFLLVTSNYHSARAGAIFRAPAASHGMEMRVIAARDEFFQPDSWWHSRDAQKTVFFEWVKTVATALGH